MYSIGFFIGGIRRIQLITQMAEDNQVSPIHCYLEPFIFFNIYGPQASAMMALMISVDRLIAVALLKIYNNLHIVYAFWILGSVFGIAAVSYIIGLILAVNMDQRTTTIALCFGPYAGLPAYGIFYSTLVPVLNGRYADAT